MFLNGPQCFSIPLIGVGQSHTRSNGNAKTDSTGCHTEDLHVSGWTSMFFRSVHSLEAVTFRHKQQLQCQNQLHGCRKRTSMFLVGPPCFSFLRLCEGHSSHQEAMAMPKAN